MQTRRAAGLFAGVSRALDLRVVKYTLTQKKQTPPSPKGQLQIYLHLKVSAALEFGGQVGNGTTKALEQLQHLWVKLGAGFVSQEGKDRGC